MTNAFCQLHVENKFLYIEKTKQYMRMVLLLVTLDTFCDKFLHLAIDEAFCDKNLYLAIVGMVSVWLKMRQFPFL